MGGWALLCMSPAPAVLFPATPANLLFLALWRRQRGGGESPHGCAWLLRVVWGCRRPHCPALPGTSWLGSQPCGIRAAAHQPAPWHWARDASQPGEEAAWPAASSQCPSCQAGGRPGRAETPGPGQATVTREPSGWQPQAGTRGILWLVGAWGLGPHVFSLALPC